MFDVRAPLHSPLDYSNTTVTPGSHTHIHASDLQVAHKGGAAEAVTKVLIDFTATGEEKVRVC